MTNNMSMGTTCPKCGKHDGYLLEHKHWFVFVTSINSAGKIRGILRARHRARLSGRGGKARRC